MLSTDSIYIIILLSGIIGGIGHCTAMCGPLITVFSTHGVLSAWRFRSQLIYHSGRIMSYAIIGGSVALAGSSVSVLSKISFVQKSVMAICGFIMIVAGLSMIFSISIIKIKNPLSSEWLMKIIKKIEESGRERSVFPLGILNGFIPCGLLYSAFISAGAFGASEEVPIKAFLKGMFLLALFGLGSTPALVLFTGIISKGIRVSGRIFYRIAGFLIILAGSLFLRMVYVQFKM